MDDEEAVYVLLVGSIAKVLLRRSRCLSLRLLIHSVIPTGAPKPIHVAPVRRTFKVDDGGIPRSRTLAVSAPMHVHRHVNENPWISKLAMNHRRGKGRIPMPAFLTNSGRGENRHNKATRKGVSWILSSINSSNSFPCIRCCIFCLNRYRANKNVKRAPVNLAIPLARMPGTTPKAMPADVSTGVVMPNVISQNKKATV